VEDLTTSYELHSHGWRSFYYPHAVSIGLAPADIWGVYRQRGQWALDTMRLFVWDNPLFKRGLPWQGRMSYLVIPLTYLGAGFVYFDWKDGAPYPGRSDFWGLHTGLVTNAGVAKPSLAAFRDAVKRAHG